MGNNTGSTHQLTGYSRWKWLHSQTFSLPVTRLGSYLSPVLPCFFGGSPVIGSFVAEPDDPTKHPILYSQITSWFLLGPNEAALQGVVRGSIARQYRNVPSFHIGGPGLRTPTEVRGLLIEFGDNVDLLAPAFFAGRSFDDREKLRRVLEICDLIFHPTELEALQAAFPEFFSFLSGNPISTAAGEPTA